MVDKPRENRLSARELILTLIDSSRAESLAAGYFIAAGQIFDMDPGSIRVALARLVREGSLSSEGRGRYGLGSRAGTLQALVRNWAKIETYLVPWRGDWLTVLVSHLARSNKVQVRGNERSLGLFGFAESLPGVWIRPANLSRNLSQVREALLELGLEAASICAQVSVFEPADLVDPSALWGTDGLNGRYRAHIQMLAESTTRLADLSDDAAARETLLIGRQVTRDILLDPLLPDALVDADGRREMISAMQAYDHLGKTYWREFFQRHEPSEHRVQVSGQDRGRGEAAQKPAA